MYTVPIKYILWCTVLVFVTLYFQTIKHVLLWFLKGKINREKYWKEIVPVFKFDISKQVQSKVVIKWWRKRRVYFSQSQRGGRD